MFSPRYNCAFIHVPKTGGSSVRAVFIKLQQRGLDNPYFFNHQTALEHYQSNPVLYWEMFSFAVIRNPWDRMVSWYTMPKGGKWSSFLDHQAKLGLSFIDWVVFMYVRIRQQRLDNREHLYREQVDYITDNDGRVMVDQVCRFEKLNEHWDAVCAAIGLPDGKLQHYAKSEGRRPYREYYDEKTMQLVAEMYANDVDQFGYTF
jgi:chondroitin 4-sulfotransferase 11